MTPDFYFVLFLRALPFFDKSGVNAKMAAMTLNRLSRGVSHPRFPFGILRIWRIEF
jgi:hypothetical protein